MDFHSEIGGGLVLGKKSQLQKVLISTSKAEIKKMYRKKLVEARTHVKIVNNGKVLDEAQDE